jgi:ribosomal protein S18 acetylase RimI-like enzyme
MEIVDFELDMAEGVARSYNDVVAGAPYCEQVGGEWFVDLKKLHRQPLVEENILVADQREGVAGFVHIGVAAPAQDDWHVKGEPGVIRFLSYRRAERAVGAALLREAERRLRAQGRTKIVAGNNSFLYPFYHLPFGHISEQISHLPPLFGMAGYDVEESEVFFVWKDFDPPRIACPDLDFEISGGWQDDVGGMGPGVELHVRQGDAKVGVCEIVRLGSRQWRPALAETCFCTGLHLDDHMQGKGVGKYLLARGLAEMRKSGARHAMISTDWNNWRAYLFYTNFGFTFLDRTFGFAKSLTASGD